MVALLGVSVASSEAGGGHFRHGGGSRVFVGVGVGPAFWWPGPFWWPAPVWGPPTVVVQQPPVFIEQPQVQQQMTPSVGSAPPAQQFWYFCEPTGAYYPNVQTCTEPWIKVPARVQ
jgi:hypothetical protein